jgi:hypothetical protein
VRMPRSLLEISSFLRVSSRRHCQVTAEENSHGLSSTAADVEQLWEESERER